MGVSTPRAAAVAAATVGFASDLHIPNGMILTIWGVIHDVSVRRLIGECLIFRQHYQRTGGHPEAALHRGAHTDLHRHNSFLFAYGFYRISSVVARAMLAGLPP
jgi:hypothetical protein